MALRNSPVASRPAKKGTAASNFGFFAASHPLALCTAITTRPSLPYFSASLRVCVITRLHGAYQSAHVHTTITLPDRSPPPGCLFHSVIVPSSPKSNGLSSNAFRADRRAPSPSRLMSSAWASPAARATAAAVRVVNRRV